jgi:mono/diheme cytochrome c family protein
MTEHQHSKSMSGRSAWGWRRASPIGLLLLWAGVAHSSAAQPPGNEILEANARGWQIPPNALQERSPLMATPAVFKKGQSVFVKQCQPCHGPEGKGDGPYGDRKQPPADLTASVIPDGIVFYKVWNGRSDPSMPAFKSLLTRDDIWHAIEFAKSLRKGGAQPPQ